MNSELPKNDVLNLLNVWAKWINGPEPAHNKPDEFKKWDDIGPKGMFIGIGMFVHLYLWILRKLGAVFRFPLVTIWASKTRIKYDYLWYEPISCGYTNAFADMGLGYLELGKVEEAITCLSKSWRVYPCPHNTTYGLTLRLYNKLKNYPEAAAATSEYQEMWEQFKAS
jgi:tetratricopeptide (TPR) repeat protein